MHLHSPSRGFEVVMEWWPVCSLPSRRPIISRRACLLDFTREGPRVAHKSTLRGVSETLKIRYTRVRYIVKFKCTLIPVLSDIPRWWDHHLLPHPADMPHLFADTHTKEYLLSVRRYFDARGGKMATLPSGWRDCEGCKHRFILKFTGGRSDLCIMYEEDFYSDY